MALQLPPLPSLRLFEAAGRLQSFMLAADELHLTHGTAASLPWRRVRQAVVALLDYMGRRDNPPQGFRSSFRNWGRK